MATFLLFVDSYQFYSMFLDLCGWLTHFCVCAFSDCISDKLTIFWQIILWISWHIVLQLTLLRDKV